MQTISQKITAAAGYQGATGGRVFMIQSCDVGDVLNVTLSDAHGHRYSVNNVGIAFKARPPAGFNSIEITTPVDANVSFIVSDGDVDLQHSSLGVTITNGNGNPVPVSLVSEPGAPVQVSAPAGAPVNVAVQGTVNVTGATMTATNVGINNTAADPVPVSLTASNVGINNTAANPVPVSLVSEPGAPVATLDTKALTVANPGPVAVAANATGTPVIAADATRRAVRFYNPSANPVAITCDAATTFANAVLVLNQGDMWNETDAPGAAWYAATPAATGATINLQTVKA